MAKARMVKHQGLTQGRPKGESAYPGKSVTISTLFTPETSTAIMDAMRRSGHSRTECIEHCCRTKDRMQDIDEHTFPRVIAARKRTEKTAE